MIKAGHYNSIHNDRHLEKIIVIPPASPISRSSPAPRVFAVPKNTNLRAKDPFQCHLPPIRPTFQRTNAPKGQTNETSIRASNY